MKTISLSYILIVFTILLSTQVMAQPANDDCSSAQAIGNLPVPAACPSGIGGTLNIAGTLVGATSGNPYDYQNACSGLGGPNMGVPANDVWYTFVATGLEAVIDITSTFANPNVAVYPGVCGNFGGGVGGCAVGIGGSVSLSVEQMTIGETYYLQVSGNVGQTGTFNMDISNNIGCEDCLNASTVTVNPQPVNGMYLPGQTVDFCYKIDQWTQTNTNWLHGVQMDFGSGWDVTTLTTTAPAACQGSGTWAYYPAGITATLGTASTADDVAWPPGFYFNTGGDGNPGNNYGDDCQGIIGAGTWEFCISITVNSICSPGSDLSVTFNTSGDGESGGWDDLGCSFDPTYFVNAVGACCPPNMSSTPSCSNSATGSATATPDGVFAPYDFVWEDATNTVISTTNGVAGANTISNVSPGTYTVIITDVNLCEVSDTVVVGSVTTALNITDPAPVCEPNTVDITAASVTTGSTAGSTFTYFTDAVATITYGTPTAATDTVYYIVATANGCTDTAAVNVMVIDMPVANAGIDDTTCTLTYNLNATLSLGTSTGSWTGSTPAGIIFTNAASATTVATAPSAGSYELYWEEDNTNGCTDVDTVVISFSNLSYTTTLIQPTCGNSNGTITVNAIDGLTPYQYSNDSALTFQALDSFPNLAQGSYDVVVVDALGCIQTSDEVLIDSNSPVIDSLSLTQPLCNGDLNGEVVVHATGGGTPYQYSIDAGGLQPDSTFAGLAGATPYLFTVEDAVGCTDTMSIVLIDPVLLVLDSAIGTDVVCNGDDNGTINLYAQGGTGTLEYSIDNEATYGTASSFTDLAPATYLVWVKDANGCTDSTQVLIQEPVVLSIPNVVDSVVCFGESNGQITVTPLGGIEPYSYFWTTSLGVDSIETGLAAGNVTVTVTDANMCSQDSTFTVFEPAQFTYTTDSQNANCNQPDGWATVIGFAGGTGAYTYDWGAGPTANDTLFNLIPGNYSVTIADANSCDTAITITVGNNLGVVLDSLSLMQPLCSGDLNGEVVVHATGGVTSYQFSVNSGVLQPDSLFTGLTGATSYLFTVEDAVGCTDTMSIVLIDPVLLVLDSAIGTDVVCNGDDNGTINLYAQGGTGILEYSIDNEVTYGAISSFTGLAPATYLVWVRDENGCSDSTQVIIQEPAPISIPNLVIDAKCFGSATGQIQILPQGGTPPYAYGWGPAVSNGTIASNLIAGTYTVTVADAHFCWNDSTFVVEEPTQFSYTTDSQNANCNLPDGWAAVIGFSGGTGGYTYLWDAAAGNQTTDTAFNLAPGNYDVMVMDDSLCDTTITITVGNNPLFTTSITDVVNVKCKDGADGSATANGSDPLVNYTYSWNTVPVQNTQTATGLQAGIWYVVTVTDPTTTCFEKDSVLLTEPDSVTIVATGTQTICAGQSADLSVTAQGGSGTYTYTWDNGLGSGQNQTVSPAPGSVTIYTVFATDDSLCTSAPATVIVTVYQELTVVASPNDTICTYESTQLNATPNFGNGGPYSYSWSPSAGLNNSSISNPIANPTQATMYYVTLSDGCSPDVVDSVYVGEWALPIASAEATDNVCIDDGWVTFSNTSNVTTTDTNTVTWFFGDGSYANSPWDMISYQYGNVGVYSVSMAVSTPTNMGACRDTIVVVPYVEIYPLPIPDFLSEPNPTTMFEPEVEFSSTPTLGTPAAWHWDFAGLDSSIFPNPIYQFPADTSGSYPVTLTVTDDKGCVSSITKIVVVNGEYGLFVPNTFTPDFDNKNDVFMAKGFGIAKDDFTMLIFDRWGEKIFEAHDIDEGWDGFYKGTRVKTDTYVWKIIFKDVNGEKHTKHGHVNIIQ